MIVCSLHISGDYDKVTLALFFCFFDAGAMEHRGCNPTTGFRDSKTGGSVTANRGAIVVVVEKEKSQPVTWRAATKYRHIQ